MSSTAFVSSATAYAQLTASAAVKRFDLGTTDTTASKTFTDTVSGIENLTGTAMNDTLAGDANANVLTGGKGSDTFVFARGSGADVVRENDATPGNTDVMQFMAGISASQLWFRKAGNDLEASIIGTADKATIQNWYLGSEYHVEQFKTSDGKVLLDTQVDKLVQAMAGFTPPAMGQISLTAAQQAALAPVLAANWH